MQELIQLSDEELKNVHEKRREEYFAHLRLNMACAGLDSYDAVLEGCYEYAFRQFKASETEMLRRGLAA